MRASVESVQRRVSAPPPKGGVWEYTEEQAVSDDAEAQDNSSADTEIDIEGQKVNTGEPLEEVNLTRSNRPTENPIAARFCTSSSRTRVTETTTTENTHRIRETTIGDVRSLCAALGISDTSTENFLRRYGAECVHEKAQLLETAMQTQSIRNPTGWLHAALKDDYTFTPVRLAAQEVKAQKPPPRPYVPPAVPSAEQEQDAPVIGNLQEALSRMEDSSVFAKEFLLRQRGNVEGRASP